MDGEKLNLGLADEGASAPSTATTKKSTSKKDTSVEKADAALKNAAATAALKAAVEANNEISQREAEKTYILEKKKHMLTRCKNDRVVKFTGQKIFAQFFGEIYTFLYNGIPVTVKFDGSTQEFPEFVYNKIMDKISAVSESNTPKDIIEDRTK